MQIRTGKRGTRLSGAGVARGGFWSRRLLAVLLVLSLWHAPVPWVHAHDLRGTEVEHLERLHRHVDAFHASEIAAGESRLELHTHLVLPWERDGGCDSPAAPHLPGSDDLDYVLLSVDAASTPTGKISAPAFDELLANTLANPSLIALFGQSLETSLSALRCGTHFFETYGCSVSIADLVSVRLC